LLWRQSISELREASLFLPPHPAPPKPLILGQHVLLASSSARTYFGHLKSIIRLEKSYLVISVSPAPSAYGKYPPLPCHIYLPILFLILPKLRLLQHTYLASLLSNAIYE